MFWRNPVRTVFWEIIIENTKQNTYKSHEIPLNHNFCWSNTPANIRKPAATPFGPGNDMQHLKSPLIGSRHDISTRRCPGYAPPSLVAWNSPVDSFCFHICWYWVKALSCLRQHFVVSSRCAMRKMWHNHWNGVVIWYDLYSPTHRHARILNIANISYIHLPP